MRRVDSLSPTLRLGAAIALLVFALVEAMRLLALAVSPSLYAVAACAALAVTAALAGVGLWLRKRWAPEAIVAFGCVFAATRLIEALVLGIRPWLFALIAAVAAVVVALLLAAWVRRDERRLT